MDADLSFQPIESGALVGSEELFYILEDKEMEMALLQNRLDKSSNMDRQIEKMGHTKF